VHDIDPLSDESACPECGTEGEALGYRVYVCPECGLHFEQDDEEANWDASARHRERLRPDDD
jgi:DNA-directed RNA polymerase subunit RPC12/RpoP